MNKQMRRREARFYYSWPSNCRKNNGVRKSLTDANIRGWKFYEGKNIYIVSKCLPENYLFITKRKIVNAEWRNLAHITLTK